MKCTELLDKDHQIILRALVVLEQMADEVNKGHSVDPRDVESIICFLKQFEDEHHQTKEESALFPELLRTSAANNGPLRQMIFEHDQERSLVEGIEDALYTRKGIEFVEYADRLTSLLRTHIRKEDTILFDIAERCLSAEQDNKVTAELDQFHIDMGFLADLRRLEWTYLRRVA